MNGSDKCFITIELISVMRFMLQNIETLQNILSERSTHLHYFQRVTTRYYHVFRKEKCYYHFSKMLIARCNALVNSQLFSYLSESIRGYVEYDFW